MAGYAIRRALAFRLSPPGDPMDTTTMTRFPLQSRTSLTVLALLFGAALLAGCETTGPGATPAATAQAAPAQPPMTHSRAAEICWMSTEKGHASQDLDKRLDVVNKCIEDKMKGAAATPKS
jgi:hypothetical protein